LIVVASSADLAQKVNSRAMISIPPAFGVLGTILNTPALYQEWVEQLQSMAHLII
jgi:aspartate/tyrosine/aromatic aminotransferase